MMAVRKDKGAEIADKKRFNAAYIIASVIIASLIMSVIDAFVQPSYSIKSLVKIILFSSFIIVYFLCNKTDASLAKQLFKPNKKAITSSFLIGISVYALIVGGYLLITHAIGELPINLDSPSDIGSAQNTFWYRAFYIALVNSLLEELFFRGFAFAILKTHTNRRITYIFSALSFAIYHMGMINGWTSIGLYILAIFGLFGCGCVLNKLVEKSGSFYTSWIVHMFCNFGINTVGAILFGLI